MNKNKVIFLLSGSLALGGCGGAGSSLRPPGDSVSPPPSRQAAPATTVPAATDAEAITPPPGTFAAVPALLPLTDTNGKLALRWEAGRGDADAPETTPATTSSPTWTVAVRPETGGSWKRIAAVADADAKNIWQADLSSASPQKSFVYRVLKNSKPVFGASVPAIRPESEIRRVIVLDPNSGSDTAPALAFHSYAQRPDLLLLTATPRNAAVYNADSASDKTGAPLLRHVRCALPPLDSAETQKNPPPPGWTCDAVGVYWIVLSAARKDNLDAARSWVREQWMSDAAHAAKHTVIVLPPGAADDAALGDALTGLPASTSSVRLTSQQPAVRIEIEGETLRAAPLLLPEAPATTATAATVETPGL